MTEFRYDENGNLNQTIDALGNSSFQTTDSFGRVTSFTDRRGNTTTLEYDQLIGSARHFLYSELMPAPLSYLQAP